MTQSNAGGVRPLDLVVVQKHAFLSGWVAAKNVPAYEESDGNAEWVHYEPYERGPLARIKAALEPSQPDTIGAAWMREQAADLMDMASKNCLDQFTYPAKTKEHRDYQTGAIVHANAAIAIRAIPLPTNADLLAEAMKLPEVDIARVNQLERAVVASAMVGQIIGFLGDDDARIAAFRAACGPELLSKARAAIAPFTAAKEAT